MATVITNTNQIGAAEKQAYEAVASKPEVTEATVSETVETSEFKRISAIGKSMRDAGPMMHSRMSLEDSVKTVESAKGGISVNIGNPAANLQEGIENAESRVVSRNTVTVTNAGLSDNKMTVQDMGEKLGKGLCKVIGLNDEQVAVLRGKRDVMLGLKPTVEDWKAANPDLDFDKMNHYELEGRYKAALDNGVARSAKQGVINRLEQAKELLTSVNLQPETKEIENEV